MHYPAAIPGGEVNHSFMTIMDVLPTFLEIAGIEHPGAGSYKDGREVNAIEGQSFWPHLAGTAPMVHAPDDTAGWSANGGHGALIRGDYKLINDRMPSGGTGVTPWRLYNIAEDPGENVNQYDNPEYAGIIVSLKRQLAQRRQDIGDVVAVQPIQKRV